VAAISPTMPEPKPGLVPMRPDLVLSEWLFLRDSHSYPTPKPIGQANNERESKVANKSKIPSHKQLRALERVGITPKPAMSRLEAQALIDAHYRPKPSGRRRQKPITPTRRKKLQGVAARYWFTPKVWNKSCSHCEASASVAYRPGDRRYACAACVERLKIKARESEAWLAGGSRAGPVVTIRKASR